MGAIAFPTALLAVEWGRGVVAGALVERRQASAQQQTEQSTTPAPHSSPMLTTPAWSPFRLYQESDEHRRGQNDHIRRLEDELDALTARRDALRRAKRDS